MPHLSPPSAPQYRAVDLIRRKRDGQPLEPDEIAWMVRAHETGAATDYHWAAMLMAILWRGMNPTETAALTRAMIDSGSVLTWDDLDAPPIDKHSTGGVGDKTSLILGPIAAACGVPVPMVSGRGLGHTGGTLDKLEAIPGVRVALSTEEFRRLVRRHRLALIGQTDEIAPADRWMYALRDATATVESIPLITASILSKKFAEGIDGLVLDVKTGDGAFMATLEDSQALAESLIVSGRALGKRVVALVTRMDQPLGRQVGNAHEVAEAIACLKGDGPDDLTDLSLELAAEMICLGGVEPNLDAARRRAQGALEDGSALEVFRRVIADQGGDPRVIDQPEAILPRPRGHVLIAADPSTLPATGGFVAAIACRRLALAIMRLGAGRALTTDRIDHAVGLELFKKVGDPVAPGEPLARLDHTLEPNDPRLVHAHRELTACWSFAPLPIPNPPSLIVTRLANPNE